MIFLQIARPMPLPGYSVRACRRWNTTKIFSASSGAMPIPLSVTLEQPLLILVFRLHGNLRRFLAAELDRVADQVLEELRQLGAVRPNRAEVGNS